jgi:hypothetical protein
MDPVFAAIEASALSMWLRDSPSLWAFPFVLILHTWGLAFLVGANVAVDARILGVAARVPLGSLQRYYRVMWAGFWLNAVSGVLLLIAYPTKALTNPLFYVKLALIAVGLLMATSVRRQTSRAASGDALPPRLKLTATASLVCWTAAIFAGRLLAYTYSRLMVDELA